MQEQAGTGKPWQPICVSAARDSTMRSMKGLAVLAMSVLSLAVIACGGDSAGDSAANGPATGGVDIRGKITELATPEAGVSSGAIVVEGEIEADSRYAKAWVRLKDTTVVLRRQGADTVAASVGDLQVGTRVEIMFEGVVAQLDPVQASAGEITIIE